MPKPTLWGQPFPPQNPVVDLLQRAFDSEAYSAMRANMPWNFLLPTSPFQGQPRMWPARASAAGYDMGSRYPDADSAASTVDDRMRPYLYQATTDPARRGGARVQRHNGIDPAVRAVIDSILFNSTIPPAATKNVRFMYTPQEYNVEGLYRPARGTPEDTIYLSRNMNQGTPIHEMQHRLFERMRVPTSVGWLRPGAAGEYMPYQTSPWPLTRPVLNVQQPVGTPQNMLADSLLRSYWGY